MSRCPVSRKLALGWLAAKTIQYEFHESRQFFHTVHALYSPKKYTREAPNPCAEVLLRQKALTARQQKDQMRREEDQPTDQPADRPSKQET